MIGYMCDEKMFTMYNHFIPLCVDSTQMAVASNFTV